MSDTFRYRGFAKRRIIRDFFTPFPVVNQQITLRIFEDHIDRSRNPQLLVIHRPFCAVWPQFGEIRDKLSEKPEFDAVVQVHNAIIVAFDIVVHIGASAGCGVAISIPRIADFFAGHFVIFICGICRPFLASQDIRDDFVGIELGEMVVVPGGDGSVAGFAVNRVFVADFFEGDELVAGVWVFLGEERGNGFFAGDRDKFGHIMRL